MNRCFTAALLATVLAIAACSSKEPQAGGWGGRPSSTKVIVENVRFEPAVTRAEAVGTSRARLSTDVYPASSGEVVAVLFEPGQFVSEGDALAEIEARAREFAAEAAGPG